MKRSKKFAALLVTLCLLILLVGILPVHGESELYGNVLRLHVLANSDSDADQARKLLVRDAILAASEPILKDCRTRDEAIAAVQDNFAVLESAAREALASSGSEDAITITLSEEVYPTRSYESFCFPSGKYLSLRVLIGDAEGQNWWCVLFPPMCLGAASDSDGEDAMIAVGLTGSQYRVITETDEPIYSVKLRILEVLEENLRR